MTTDDAPPHGRSALSVRLRRAAPALILLVLLAGATLVPAANQSGLRLESPDRSRVDQLRAAIGDLTIGSLVLVACDADLGTYPEIRAATRAALADLSAHGAQLAIVSFTPDGRAIAAAEQDRIAREGIDARPADLGYVAGSEAGLVRAITSIVPSAASGTVVDAIRQRGGGIGAFDLVLIVSGSDISARSWVEQVGSRVPTLRMVAIAPTFLDPELEPYLRAGQLSGLLSTVRDDAAYSESVRATSEADLGPIPTPLAMLLGMLAALGVLADSGIRHLVRRSGRPSFRRRAS